MTQRPAVAAGGLIFVSGITAADANGRTTGDITAQTRRVLDRLGEALAAEGSGLAHAVTLHVYLRDADDFAAMNDVYASYWNDAPPSRTTVVTGLVGSETLVEIAAVAVPAGRPRTALQPDGWSKSPLPYSYAVRAGDTVFLAGLVARDRVTNRPVAGGVRAQLDTIMANAAEILAAAGLSLQHVTSARVYLADGASFPEMNEGWRAHFGAAKPARATVIAGLMNPAYAIEVTFVAHAGPVERLAADPPSENLSGAVKAGSMIFVSGMLAGVVDATVWLPDLAHAAAMNSSYRQVFQDAPPARVTVGAGLVAKDALVEIAVTAILKK